MAAAASNGSEACSDSPASSKEERKMAKRQVATFFLVAKIDNYACDIVLASSIQVLTVAFSAGGRGETDAETGLQEAGEGERTKGDIEFDSLKSRGAAGSIEVRNGE